MDTSRPLREPRQHGDFFFPVSAYETIVEKDAAMPLYYHWHPQIEIFFITSGRANFQVEGDEFLIEEGDVLLIKPNALHGSHDCFRSHLEFRAVVFDYSFVAGIGNDRIEQKYLKPLLDERHGRYILLHQKNSVKEALFQVLNRTYLEYEEKEEGYELLIRALLLQAFYDIVAMRRQEIRPASSGGRKGLMMRHIVQYVEENYRNRLTLLQLARELAVSEGYLCRFFKENFHMTFVDYVNRVRLRAGEELLRTSDGSVGQIALDTGFSSGNYFTVNFRKIYHMTPQAYRRSCEENEAVQLGKHNRFHETV